MIARCLLTVWTLKQQDVAVLSYSPEKSKLNFFLCSFIEETGVYQNENGLCIAQSILFS